MFVEARSFIPDRTRGGVSRQLLVPDAEDFSDPNTLSVEMMNQWYDFETSVSQSSDVETYLWNSEKRERTVVVLDNRSYRLFVQIMPSLTMVHLQKLAAVHLMSISQQLRKADAFERVREHVCTVDCDQACVVLVQRRNERALTVLGLEAIGMVASSGGHSPLSGATSRFRLEDCTPFIASSQDAATDGGNAADQAGLLVLFRPSADFPEMYTEDLRLKVIHEWQMAMGIAKWTRHTCAEGPPPPKRHVLPDFSTGGPRPVLAAFRQVSAADLQYAAACRLTCITYLISVEEDGRVGYPRQRMNKGHCAIIPQDFGGMSTILPALREDNGLGICVVFVRHGLAEPTVET
ncbi:hypothetical protein K488DRAFT_75399, partial [Vararia minispora EC-137]